MSADRLAEIQIELRAQADRGRVLRGEAETILCGQHAMTRSGVEYIIDSVRVSANGNLQFDGRRVTQGKPTNRVFTGEAISLCTKIWRP